MSQKNKQDNRYGLILETPVESDYVFGAGNIEHNITTDNWMSYMSPGELQFNNRLDTYSCVSFSAINVLETILNYQIKNNMSVGNLQWLKDYGYLGYDGFVNFSDRFIAVLSGTKPGQGNSGKKVNEAIRKYGLIPEALLPFTTDTTQSEFFDKTKITQEMYDLGQEFLKRFNINYELVYTDNHNVVKEALTHSPLQVYVYAWLNPISGIYQKTGRPANHAVCLFQPEWYIFDQYTEDAREGIDYIKQMAPDFDFHSFCYAYTVTENIGAVSLAKILKDENSNAVVVAEVMTNESALYAKLLNMGIEPPTKNGQVNTIDWNKLKFDGTFILGIQDYPPFSESGNWLTNLFRAIVGAFKK